MRVATYNVHGCVGADGRRSETRIAEVIAGFNADVVGLQELDHRRTRSAGAEQARLIAEQLGWHHLFAPAMRRADEQYGNAIISRFPLTLREALALPGDGSWYCREQRVALFAVVETPTGPFHLGNTHFGLGRAERLQQARALADFVGAFPPNEPLVLLGDFNSRRCSRALERIRSQLQDVRELLPAAGPCRTFPTRWPAIAVDHIFVNRALHAVNLLVMRNPLARVASDHFPLVADLAM